MPRLSIEKLEPAARGGVWVLIIAVLLGERALHWEISSANLDILVLLVVFSSMAVIELQILKIYGDLNIEIESIPDGLNRIFKRHRHFSRVRIFAMTGDHLTGDISSLGAFQGVTIDACEVLLYDQSKDSSYNRTARQAAATNNLCDGAIERLTTLQNGGRFHKLLLGRYNFMPTEFYLIFDDKAILSGNFKWNPTEGPGVEPQHSVQVLFGNRKEARNVITTHTENFDSPCKIFPIR